MVTKTFRVEDMTQPEIFQFLACQEALKLQVKTGLKHSKGSVAEVCRQRYGCTKRTLKGVLEEMDALNVKLQEAHGLV